ncbi:MAG: protein kinase [Anaerolineae bacterium]|nr:protein kinase [Anaerolineae bacterium]
MQQENLIGTTMGQYQILDELGRGGMAIVYKAWQPSLRRYVALKVLLPYLGNDPEFIQRFQQEGIVAANLSHPHIVTIYEVGQHEGHIFIAMEYVEGTSLEQLVLDQGALPLERAVGILRQVAEALDYAHKRRFLHRDIKPANILLAEDDRVVITDFGIAKALEGSGATARLTSTGTVLGTPAYMSPEQIQGLAVDHRSDLYALGIVAYEMLSGQVPFDGTTTALLYAQVNNPPPAITRFTPGLPQHVEWTIARMLAKQSSERFVSAGEFVAALAGAAGAAVPAPAYGISATPPMPAPAPRGGTAVMPPGTQLPQYNGLPASAPTASSQPYGTVPANMPAGGPPAPYGYPPTQAAAPSPAYGYPPAASGWAEPVPAKKKRAVWPWLVGGGILLVLVAVAAVFGYFFLQRMTVARLVEEGEAALAAQDYAAAQVAFEAALEKDAENAAAYRGLGWAQYESGQYEAAGASFGNAVQLEPESVDGYKGQSISYYAVKDYENAYTASQQWVAREPNNLEAHNQLGLAAYQSRRHTEARDAFLRSLELGESETAFDGLSNLYLQQGEFDSLLEVSERWAQIAPESADAYRMMGLAFNGLNQCDPAINAFSRSLEIQEKAESYEGLTTVYNKCKDYEGALTTAEKWINLDASDVKARVAYGNALMNLKRYDEAISVYKEANRIKETVGAYLGLTVSYHQSGDYASSLTYGEKWIALAPTDPLAFSVTGWSSFHLKRFDEAVTYFLQSAEIQENISAYTGLCNAHYALEQYNEALVANDRWVELEPRNANAHAFRGWIYVKLGDCDFATQSFTTALEINPDYSWAKEGQSQCAPAP